MAEHDVSLRIQSAIEVGNTDLKIRVKRNGTRFGTLTISKGTIDWRPVNAKRGKKGETPLAWEDFDKWMKKANRHRKG